MQSNYVRSARLVALAVALTACASETINTPGPSVQPHGDAGPVSATGGVVISQVYGGGGNSGATLTNDFIELYNAGTTDVSLNGWSVQYGSKAGTTWQVTTLSGTIASGHYYLVQEAKGSAGTDTLPTPDATGTLAMSGSDGKVALVNSTTALSGTGCPVAAPIVDLVGYGAANCFEGTGATHALTNSTAAIRKNSGATDTNDNSADFTTGTPTPRNSDGTSGSGGDTGGTGDSTGTGGGGGGGSVSIQPRTDPLPVGFQTQLYASGASDVTWASESPAVVSVDPSTGVVTALSLGSAWITATSKSDPAAKGSTKITTTNAQVGPGARVGYNTAEGTPTDADPSDDIIIARRQYTLSYNASHGGPNWVSWNLDATHKGSASRCNCFTADTALLHYGVHPYDTNDWINGGTWSRGHMSPSADWADADGDNAPTFFLSNMIPQNQTANAGAWGALENYLRTVATGNTEIYIVSGPIFTKNRSGAGVDGFGWMNSKGHIAVPDSMWKIAVIVPDTRDVNSINSTSDVQVLAVNMPNDASATGTFDRYATTVDAIERSTGYDLLAALPDSIEKIVEANDHAPATTLAANSATTVSVGSMLNVTGSFTDVDATASAPWAVTFDWGDGTTSRTLQTSMPTTTLKYTRTHAYAHPGNYTVTFTVTDRFGASSVSTLSVTAQ